MKKLPVSFYQRNEVVRIAKDLLGKILVTQWNGSTTSGRIVECEAYNGIIDKASHAYNSRRTNRTEIMYAPGGLAYVYLCYGIHHLFNIVTNVGDIPHAILIRALEPVEGTDFMLERTGKKQLDYSLTKGPGNVSKSMGILTRHSGFSLQSNEIYLIDDGYIVKKNSIVATSRIGVDYAEEDAGLPYRFFIKDNPFVSGKSK